MNRTGSCAALYKVIEMAMACKELDFSDPVFKHISEKNGLINKMMKNSLQQELKKLRLSPKGAKGILQKRLKNYSRRIMLAAQGKDKPLVQDHDYLLVIDYEATCKENNDPDDLHEIIEFPIVLIDTKQKQILGEFQSYVKPEFQPKLSKFCTELTGITQDKVDAAPMFPEVLRQVQTWMEQRGLGGEGAQQNFAVVTDGDWDMYRFLANQCQYSQLPMPPWSSQWINIRLLFSSFYKCRHMKLSKMVETLGLVFEGKLHSGFYNTRNIARIVVQMLKDGALMRVNQCLVSLPEENGQPCNEVQRVTYNQETGKTKARKVPGEKGADDKSIDENKENIGEVKERCEEGEKNKQKEDLDEEMGESETAESKESVNEVKEKREKGEKNNEKGEEMGESETAESKESVDEVKEKREVGEKNEDDSDEEMVESKISENEESVNEVKEKREEGEKKKEKVDSDEEMGESETAESKENVNEVKEKREEGESKEKVDSDEEMCESKTAESVDEVVERSEEGEKNNEKAEEMSETETAESKEIVDEVKEKREEGEKNKQKEDSDEEMVEKKKEKVDRDEEMDENETSENKDSLGEIKNKRENGETGEEHNTKLEEVDKTRERTTESAREDKTDTSEKEEDTGVTERKKKGQKEEDCSTTYSEEADTVSENLTHKDSGRHEATSPNTPEKADSTKPSPKDSDEQWEGFSSEENPDEWKAQMNEKNKRKQQLQKESELD